MLNGEEQQLKPGQSSSRPQKNLGCAMRAMGIELPYFAFSGTLRGTAIANRPKPAVSTAFYQLSPIDYTAKVCYLTLSRLSLWLVGSPKEWT